MRLVSSAALAALLLALTTAGAAAQGGDSSKVATLAAPTITAARWDTRPVGLYNLELTLPERLMPARLTVSDVGGKLVASLWPEGDHEGHEMAVTVKDTELVFDAEAPRGHVQIVLQHEGDRVVGTWSMGPQRGALRGTIAR
jgi:hypothetical protein